MACLATDFRRLHHGLGWRFTRPIARRKLVTKRPSLSQTLAFFQLVSFWKIGIGRDSALKYLRKPNNPLGRQQAC
jgi:hypothetical protein